MIDQDVVRVALADNRRWFPQVHRRKEAEVIAVLGLELASETGECADAIKKWWRRDLDAVAWDTMREQLALELVDVLENVACLAGLLDIDLHAATATKRAINDERFG